MVLVIEQEGPTAVTRERCRVLRRGDTEMQLRRVAASVPVVHADIDVVLCDPGARNPNELIREAASQCEAVGTRIHQRAELAAAAELAAGDQADDPRREAAAIYLRLAGAVGVPGRRCLLTTEHFNDLS